MHAVARLDGASAAQDTLIASMRETKAALAAGRAVAPRDFLKLWTGQTTARSARRCRPSALPLAAVLVLDATTFEVALLGTVEFLPFLSSHYRPE